MNIIPKTKPQNWQVPQALYDEIQSQIASAIFKQREIIAQWMITNGFSTGHGDTIEDLLAELKWQIEDIRFSLLQLKRGC